MGGLGVYYYPNLKERVADVLDIPRGVYIEHRDLLKKYFTKEAYKSLEGIPMICPPWFPDSALGYASDNSLLCSIGDLLLGIAPTTQVVVSSEVLSIDNQLDNTVVHEYTHHGHRLGFVRSDVFRNAYRKCRKDKSCEELVEYTERKSMTNVLLRMIGWPKDNERIATLAKFVVEKPDRAPQYVHECYRRLLKVSKDFTQAVL